MSQSFPAANANPKNNVHTSGNIRKRPLPSSSATAPLPDLSDISKFIMTTDENMNLVLPSTLSKKKKQQKQSEQQEFSETDLMDIPVRVTSQRNVPAFLHKLYNMVDDPSTDHLVRWSKGGNSFLVIGHEEFARTILPRFYKHNTFSSFVRQLNMYDFHKIPNIQQNIMPAGDSEIWEFSSPHFQKGRPELLVFVTRKRIRNNNNNNSKQETIKQSNDADKVNLGELVRNITSIKHHQSSITNDLAALHRDNEIIWQETLLAREKHEMHQQVLSKILQFLAAVFSNDVNALTDLSKEDILQAQHISQGHEQAMLRKSTRHPFPAPSDSGISSDNSSSAGYLASDSSNDVSQMESTTNSNSSSGSEDDIRPRSTGKKNSAFYQENPSSAYSSPGPSKPNAKPNMQRARSLQSTQPTVDVYKLDKRFSNSFNPVITNNHRASTKVPPSINPLQPSLVDDRSRSAEDITNDIDQLQVNVETLATQLGIDPAQYSDKIFSDFDGFSHNYSSMISAASRMDKLRLFELAGESPHHQQHQQQDNLYGTPYAFLSNVTPYDFNSLPNVVDSNYHSASTYFRDLVKSDDDKPPEELFYHNNMPSSQRPAEGMPRQHLSVHNQRHQSQVNNTMFDINAPNVIPDRPFVFQQPPPKQ